MSYSQRQEERLSPPKKQDQAVANIQAPERAIVTALRRQQRSPLLLILLAWVSVTSLLVGTALVANINWATPRLESMLSEITNRHVSLGKINWTVNFNGLVVATDKLTVTELDGKPFMIAGPSEIGVDPRALIAGNIKVRHFGFMSPEFWAVEIEPGRWNFQDLFSLVENITSLHIEAGKLHLVRTAEFRSAQGKAVSGHVGIRIARRLMSRWRSSTLSQTSEDIYLDLVRPQKDNDWPITVSFTLPEKNYRTRIEINAVGRGLLAEWHKNKYKFDLAAYDVDAKDLSMISPMLSGLSGRIALQVSGEGIYDEGLGIIGTAKTRHLEITTPEYGSFTISNAALSGGMRLDRKTLVLDNLRLNTNNIHTRSSGYLTTLEDGSVDYKLQVNTRIQDLNQLARIVPAKILPVDVYKSLRSSGSRPQTLAQLLHPAKLTGQGTVDAELYSLKGKMQVKTNIDLEGVSSKALFTKGPFKQFSLLAFLSDRPLRLKSNIKTFPDRAEISDTRIYVAGSVIKASGFWDVRRQRSSMDFHGQALDLANLSKEINRSQDLYRRLQSHINLPSRKGLRLAGLLNLAGRIDGRGDDTTTTLNGDLVDAGIFLTDGSLSAQRVNGDFSFTGNRLRLDDIKGELGRGAFRLNGTASPEAYNLSLKAANIDLLQARKALEILRLKEPLLERLAGTAADVRLSVKGPARAPIIAMVAVPKNIVFRPPGSWQAVTVNSGVIRYNSQAVQFENVGGRFGAGRFTLQGTAALGENAQYNLNVKASHADLSDTQALLNVLRINVPMLKDLSGTVRQAKVSITGPSRLPIVKAVAYPSNLRYHVSRSGQDLYLTAGNVLYDASGLRFQNTRGTLGQGSFQLNGTVRLVPSEDYHLDLKATNADLSDTRQLLYGLRINMPYLDNLSGAVRQAHIKISGDPASPSISMVAYPKRVLMHLDGMAKPVHITSGQVNLDSGNLYFANTEGAVGDNRFVLNGRVNLEPIVYYDLSFKSKRADLTDATAALRAFQIEAPWLTHHRLSGPVKDVSVKITGPPAAPTITLSATPANITVHTADAARNLAITSGTISYDQDTLAVNGLTITGQNSSINADLIFESISTRPKLRKLKVSTMGIELSDLDFYLRSLAAPAALRQQYGNLLARFGLSGLYGKVKGEFLAEAQGEGLTFNGSLSLAQAGALLRFADSNMALNDVKGVVASSGETLQISDLSGRIGAARFTLSAKSSTYQASNTVWLGQMTASMIEGEFLRLLPANAREATRRLISARPISLTSAFRVNPGSAASVEFEDTRFLLGKYALDGKGGLTWSPPQTEVEPNLELALSSRDPIAASDVIPLVLPDTASGDISGSLKADLKLKGRLSRVTAEGYLAFDKVSIPLYRLYEITGKIEPEEVVLSAMTLSRAEATPLKFKSKLSIKSAKMKRLLAHDIHGDLVIENPPKGSGPTRIVLNEVTAKAAGGTLKFDGSFDLSSSYRFNLNARVDDVEADDFSTQLLEQTNEIKGRLMAESELSSEGTTVNELMSNLHGRGRFVIKDGEVTRFGPLQFKLTQANLLKEGLLGFNLNNLLASFAPVRTGKFSDIRGTYTISRGLVSSNELRYTGEDLRLRGAGTINIPGNQIDMDMAGNVPRVSRSVLGKFWGRIVGSFTLQNILGVVGGGTEKNPRTFAFKVVAPLDQPGLTASSIEKTFHWLPNEPRATPHPVLQLPEATDTTIEPELPPPPKESPDTNVQLPSPQKLAEPAASDTELAPETMDEQGEAAASAGPALPSKAGAGTVEGGPSTAAPGRQARKSPARSNVAATVRRASSTRAPSDQRKGPTPTNRLQAGFGAPLR